MNQVFVFVYIVITILFDFKFFEGVPTKKKHSTNTPFYYQAKSWADYEDVPWNVLEERPLTLAEGVNFLTLLHISEREKSIAEFSTTPNKPSRSNDEEVHI